MCAHPNRSMFNFWQDSRTSPPLTTPGTGNIRRWGSGRLLRRPATEWWLILRRRSRLCWGWGPSPASAQSLPWVSGHGTLHDSIKEQERQGRWCINDTGWSHWIDYLVKEDMMKVAWPGSNQIILVSGLKIVAKSQSELWRLITNSSAKFKTDPVSGVHAKGYHMIGTNSANSAGDDHQ